MHANNYNQSSTGKNNELITDQYLSSDDALDEIKEHFKNEPQVLELLPSEIDYI